ncbi:MAG: hypothetical protein J6V99_08610 [Neisseriaceae bacterium]|nr:hypothetical protein [Neisseriaceae bacterium]
MTYQCSVPFSPPSLGVFYNPFRLKPLKLLETSAKQLVYALELRSNLIYLYYYTTHLSCNALTWLCWKTVIKNIVDNYSYLDYHICK